MYSNKYVIELIKDAIAGERKSCCFYTDFANSMKDIDDKKTLEQISLDEKKHLEMFEDIYKKLTGDDCILADEEHSSISADIELNIKNALKREFENVEAYRPILFALESTQLKNYLTEIITDEQNHAARLIYMESRRK